MPQRVLADGPGFEELLHVVGTAGLPSRSRRLQTAERVTPDDGAGGAAVQIQIADPQFAPRLFEVGRGAREDASGFC